MQLYVNTTVSYLVFSIKLIKVGDFHYFESVELRFVDY
jgi:hypothetical protein